ncbi:cytochrome P450 CYP94D108-like [Magnolia sinica]|uniref:cytochrome P450 CYP94D108-like n=1 Tax=Magnolia sinica TaxID=86752 RepID=UPI00265AD603|nr:cytochrome P450 CYP94D108-like [Magnolia sinica]
MEIFSLQSLLFFLLSISLFIFLHGQNQSKKPNSKGIKAYPIVGNLPEFLKNRHRPHDWFTEVLADQPTNTVTFQRPGKVREVITANPMNVEYMLKTNFDNYPKGDLFISLLEDFLGGGIFNSDGELWKVQRKTASFEFNTKSLRNFAVETVHFEIQHRLLPLLQKSSENGETVDLQDILERFSFDNVCKVAFNADPACLGGDGDSSSELSPNFSRAFSDATNLSAERFLYVMPFLWKIKKLFNIGSERRLRESIMIVHDFATKIIRSKKKDGSNHNDDLLSRFIASGDNSDDFLRDIVVSFILAGRDTTSTALAWFFWLLSSRPDVEQKILDELKSVRSRNPNSGEVFSLEELREMHYLHASISEALRLYPPVAIDSKECLKDDVLPDGTFIRKGWFVAYQAYAMGRMESIWGKDSRSFLPERWLENGSFRPESPFKYPVFHAGPRMCLGKEMAYIQMKLIAACLIERFEIDVLEKNKCPEHMLSLTLRMKEGLPTRIKKKCDYVGHI